MVVFRRALLLLSVLLCSAAWAAPVGQDPYIGYVYPAGGQQGTKFSVTIRGQRLGSAKDVYFTGKGVHASVVSYEGAGGALNKLQQEELKRRLNEIRAARSGGLTGGKKRGKAGQTQSANSPDNTNAQPVTLPDLPELRNLEQQNASQLKRVSAKFLNRANRPKPPIAEEVTLDVTIDPDAAPGDRELRLLTSAGLTNHLVFQVGQIPEIREPDKEDAKTSIPPTAQPPVVLNGQIMPGEVDRFALQLRQGQRLVVAAQARKLIPYLADAVPGWFQAAMAICDSDGKEIAFDDDCGFDPDPAFIFQAPRDGKYTLEIRDALYRGREDFVYRVEVGEESLIKSLFPSGSRGGVPICALAADKEFGSRLAQEHFGLASNPQPQCNEIEPNDTGQTSMSISSPHIVSGCIATPGDRDVFRIKGRAGDTVVAEVYARRMGSPLDSLLRLIDTSGRVVGWNDDHEDPQSGLLTHQADSYLSAKLPATGDYFVQVTDAEQHGSPTSKYYLRVGPAQPDFALIVTPSSLNVPAGRSVTATVYAVRKDGWDGDIDVALKDAPIGFALNGGRIPKGQTQVRMTLTAPRGQFGEPMGFQMEGHAQINGKTVIHTATPADNMMQAFAYYHLVPSEQLTVMVPRGSPMSPSLDMADGERLRIPSGGTAKVSFTVRPSMPSTPIHLELTDPPAGVTLQDVQVTRRGFILTLKADDKHAGYADNLIVEAFQEAAAKGKAKVAGQKQRVSLGVLPAVPYEIVQKSNSKP